ncbi:MAG: hypothetical protein ACRDZ8_16690 [Acidimicrobiales bacterium]
MSGLRYVAPAVARDPSPDLVLAPIRGKARTVEQMLTTFHLLFVALDPFTNQSAWILETAGRILQNFEQADCRIAWLVTGTSDECRQFLGPWSRTILTFADPDRIAVKELGLERLPALVYLGMQGKVMGAAEGWRPAEWKAITDRLAKVLSWRAPTFPIPRDPGPFEGSPALG